MPSLEMRRSTRIFVPKAKNADLVRVLRSGRRIRVDSSDVWFPVIDKHPHSPQQLAKESETIGIHNGPKLDLMELDGGEAQKAVELARVKPVQSRVITNVYSRKRKRSTFVTSSGDDVCRGKRRFGLHFVRRKKRKTSEITLLSIVFESSCGGCGSNSLFLWTILRNLRSRDVELAEVAGFLQSSPIYNVFSSVGVHLFWNCPCVEIRGVCRISQGRWMVPFFTLDFSAVPLCFVQLHIALSLRSVRLSCLSWMDFTDKDECRTIEDVPRRGINVQKNEPLLNSLVVPEFQEYRKGRKIVVAALEACKVGSNRNIVPYRSGVLTRSSSKRRKRSLRSRKARDPTHFVMQEANASLMSDEVTLKKTVKRLRLGFNQELRSSARKNPPAYISVASKDPPANISVPKSGSLGLTIYTDSPQCCSANVLVVETDRCYRVEGAEVSLDLSSSNVWVLAVKTDGVTRHSFKAQIEMRPNTINRFTHAIVWSAENGWKLEFPSRKDWLVFKELYKVCGEKNIVPTTPVVKFIPVPGVSGVTNSLDSGSSPFKRPESYIRTTSDELSRVLSSRTANYDMDSEDEVWLSKLNSELDENDLSEETFELMVDAFEKASYSSLEGFNDERAFHLDLTSPRIAEPVYRYWMKKRKQRRAPLLRVFELHEPKGAQPISKPVLRKKRSLKRTTIFHPMQRGRGKDSSALQALASEQNVVEDHYAVLRVQEAKVSADESVEVAILKRRRAQFLIENADLAIYRATMALRIADAASLVVDSQQAAAHFLD